MGPSPRAIGPVPLAIAAASGVVVGGAIILLDDLLRLLGTTAPNASTSH